MLSSPTSLIGNWPLNGDRNDYSGNGRNAEQVGTSTTLTDGLFGKAYSYHAWTTGTQVLDNDAFTFGDGSGNDQPFSISLFANVSGGGQILQKGNWGRNIAEYYIEFSFASGVNRLRFILYTEDGTARIGRSTSAYSDIFTTNTWYHVCVTYDGSMASSGIRIYLNGDRKDSVDFNSGDYATTGMSNTAENLFMPISYVGASGIVDMVSIYKGVLSESDIKRLAIGLHPFGGG